MWIKRSLVILPIGLLVFLAQSVFWAPSNERVANNESRQDRIILYMGGNPEDMNPWTSTKTTDSTISDYFFEGLLRYNRMYEVEPWLAQTVVVKHEADAVIPAGLSAEQFESRIREKYGDTVESVKPGPDKKLEIGEDAKKSLEGSPVLPALENLAGSLGTLKTLTVTFSNKPVNGKIVSAVKPDFLREIEEGSEHKLLDSHLGDLDALYSTVPAEAKKEMDLKGFTEALKGNLERLGLAAVAHRPVVEMNLHKDVYWTDGPYFSPKERTWLVTVNGDETCVLVKDSAAEAVQTVREGMDLKDSDEVVAKNYEKTFDGDGDYWWGRGPEFTARDPKLTYEHIKNPLYASPRRSSYMSIKDIRTFEDDPHRMQVVYDELYSPALSDLTGSILPYHRWNTTSWTWEAIQKDVGWKELGIDREKYNPMSALRTRDRDFAMNPSYLGAMLLEPLNGDSTPLWQNNLQVRLRRNEFYWERTPEYKFVDWYVFDPKYGVETSEMVFLTGGMDIYSAKDYQVQRYEEMEDKYYVIKRQPTTYEYLGFNMSRDVFKDKRVRLALSMAIDVEKIIKYVAYDQGDRISGPAYPVLPWYNHEFRFEHTWLTDGKDENGSTIKRKGKTEKLQYVPYDLEEARALLKEAGYNMQGGVLKKGGKPFKIQFVNSTSEGTRKHIAELARANWERLGVIVDYKTYEWNDYIQRFIMAMNFDICVLGWSGGLDFDKRQLWHSQFTPPNGLNFVGYSNPEADELMEKILKVYDPEKQIEMSHQVFDLIAADFPYIFLFSPYSTTVVDRHIVWRKQVGEDKDGNPIYEDRPLTDDFIKNSRASWRYFEPELIRRDDIPEFDD